MLIGIPSCLGPELLRNLRAMGHGDEIAIVDGNCPSQSHAVQCVGGVIRADGLGAVEILDAILQVFPLDDRVSDPVAIATVDGDGSSMAPVHQEMLAALSARKAGVVATPMAGPAFYQRVRMAHTLVASSEPRLYGNIILRKGVINPE